MKRLRLAMEALVLISATAALIPASAIAQLQPSGVTPLSGSLAATGDTSTTPYTPQAGRPINVQLTGTWVGTVTLKRQLPGQTTYSAITVNGSAFVTWTANVNEQAWVETESGATFILDFTRTSGTVTYRISQ